jgi:hypothetical protein
MAAWVACVMLIFTTVDGEEKVCADIPNFSQGAAGIANAEMCGPACLANVLVYLNKSGAIHIPQDLSHDADIANFINTLGSKEYLNTSPRAGTSMTGFLHGISKFFNQLGVKTKIETEGWCCDRNRIGPCTEFGWIQDSLKDGGNVILGIGWYHTDPVKKEYQRLSGHFLTCVGFNDETDYVLFINDPRPVHGDRSTTKYILNTLDAAYTMVSETGHRTPSPGYYSLQGIPIRRGCDLAIIDYSVSIKVIP